MKPFPVTLDYGSGPTAFTIHGTVFYSGGPCILVEAEPCSLPTHAATEALCSAVRDGRCKVPDSIRAAIDNGAKVL
jgi:hypothetical protein